MREICPIAIGTGSNVWSPYSKGVVWSPVTQRMYSFVSGFSTACLPKISTSFPSARSLFSSYFILICLSLSCPASSVALTCTKPNSYPFSLFKNALAALTVLLLSSLLLTPHIPQQTGSKWPGRGFCRAQLLPNISVSVSVTHSHHLRTQYLGRRKRREGSRRVKRVPEGLPAFRGP